jgi:hypothetical protein
MSSPNLTHTFINPIVVKRTNMKQKLQAMSDVDRQVNELIKQVNDLQKEYHFKMYLLLKQILKLRQTQIEGYIMYHLRKEKNLDLKYGMIKYVFGFDHMSPNTKKLIKSGALRSGTYLMMLRKSAKLREHTLQDKVIRKYLRKEITANDVTFTPLMNLINNKSKGEIHASREALRFYHRVKNMKKELKSLRHYFIDKRENRRLKRIVARFNKMVQELP